MTGRHRGGWLRHYYRRHMLRCVFIVECRITHFLCVMRALEVQASPHPLRYLCAKFRLYLHC